MYKAGDLRKFSWGEFPTQTSSRCSGKSALNPIEDQRGNYKSEGGDDLLRLRGQTIRDIAGCDTINHQTSTSDNMEWEIKLKNNQKHLAWTLDKVGRDMNT